MREGRPSVLRRRKSDRDKMATWNGRLEPVSAIAAVTRWLAEFSLKSIDSCRMADQYPSSLFGARHRTNLLQ